MNEQNSVLIIIGAPGSGMKLLSSSLRLFGVEDGTNDNNFNYSIPNQINQLLFQDLNYDWLSSKSLPHGYVNNHAGVMAEKRIRKYIKEYKYKHTISLVHDASIGRCILLWNKILTNMGIRADYICLLRHPWEFSHAMVINNIMDVELAHLFWLSYYRDLFNSLQNIPHLFIKFEHLISNPVKIIHHLGQKCRLACSEKSLLFNSKILKLVRPQLRKIYASELQEQYEDRFSEIAYIYNQIPPTDYEQYNEELLLSDSYNVTEILREKYIEKRDYNTGEVIRDQDVVIDKIANVIDDYIDRENESLRRSENRKYNINKVEPLYVKSGFVSMNNNKLPDTTYLYENKWKKVIVPISYKRNIAEKQLVIIPSITTGTIKISAISIINQATGKIIWTVNNRKDFSLLHNTGNAIRLPDDNNYFLLITGDGTSISMRVPGPIPDCPMEMEIWIKICRSCDVLKKRNYLILDTEDTSIKSLLSNEKLLHNNKIMRMLKPVWPEKVGNSTPITMNYLLDHMELMLKTKTYAGMANFKYPSYLISFPRAGSNYLQHVVEKSASQRCCSLYAPRPADPGCVLSFKSHALSKEFLLDEISRFYPESGMPDKLILLKRDPRDIMISFYEYVKTTKKIELRQERFIYDISYNYAFDNSPKTVETILRKVDIDPLNIAQAYSRHVHSWFKNYDFPAEKLIVKYEDLIQFPEKSFQFILDYLETGATVDINSTRDMVSQYSKETHRSRGIPYGWRTNKIHRKLVESVERELDDCISILGYS